MASKAELRVSAELDVPGETGRQARVFLIWLSCLALAVALVIARRPEPTVAMREAPATSQALDAWRHERLVIAFLVGLALPGALTWWTTRRHRRGGPHARGIVVDVTDGGELRVWGRGYGVRVALRDAEVGERLVDVYTGRLGAWRQRRLRVRPKHPLASHGLRELELATTARDEDLALGLELYGGEGDCIELGREEYLKVLERIRGGAAQEGHGA